MDEAKVNPLIIAFVQGAKWWEYHKEGATMWQSDQHEVEEEALKREENGTLGKPLVLSPCGKEIDEAHPEQGE